jgi:hypothetical protein
MLTRYFAPLIAVAAFGALFQVPASAQSLDIRNATPLVAGENHGTVDSMVGAQFWLISCHKGAVHISLRFASMGLFGNPTTATIQEVLHEGNGKVLASRVVTSPGQMVENDWPGTCSKKSTMIVELRPPSNSLVRSGGDYSLTVDGDGVDYASGAAPAGPDRIIGTYSVMVCAPDFDCQNSLAAHFAANGSVRLTDGHTGTWSVFDPDSLIYTVVIGQDRYSLKLVPGRGLFGTNDLSVPIFQAVRPN